MAAEEVVPADGITSLQAKLHRQIHLCRTSQCVAGMVSPDGLLTTAEPRFRNPPPDIAQDMNTGDGTVFFDDRLHHEPFDIIGTGRAPG